MNELLDFLFSNRPLLDKESLQLVQIDATAIAGLLILLSFSILTNNQGTDIAAGKLVITLITAMPLVPFAVSATLAIWNMKSRAIAVMWGGFSMIAAAILILFALLWIFTVYPFTSEYRDVQREITFSYPSDWRIFIADSMINITSATDNSVGIVSIWSESLGAPLSEILDTLLPQKKSISELSIKNNSRLGKNMYEISYIIGSDRFLQIVVVSESRVYVVSSRFPEWLDPRIDSIINSMELGIVEVPSAKPSLSASIGISTQPSDLRESQLITISVKDSLNKSSIDNANVTGWLFYPEGKRVMLEPMQTNNGGTIVYISNIDPNDVGKYRIKITASATGYIPVESSKTFTAIRKRI